MSVDQDRRRRVYPLRFRTIGGLLVRMRKPGWSAFEKLTSAVLILGDGLDGPGLSAAERMPALRELFEAFADSMVSWDLTDRGRPVPATREGVLAQDFELLIALARTWYVVVVQHDPDAEAERIRNSGLPQVDPQPVDTPAEGPSVDEEWLSQLPTKDIPEHLPGAPAPDAAAVV